MGEGAYVEVKGSSSSWLENGRNEVSGKVALNGNKGRDCAEKEAKGDGGKQANSIGLLL